MRFANPLLSEEPARYRHQHLGSGQPACLLRCTMLEIGRGPGRVKEKLCIAPFFLAPGVGAVGQHGIHGSRVEDILARGDFGGCLS
jgi:hypothetical protein